MFTRDGEDLHCRVTLPMTSAALGTTLSLKTLDGEEDLDIRPGTQSGSVLTLRAHGAPHALAVATYDGVRSHPVLLGRVLCPCVRSQSELSGVRQRDRPLDVADTVHLGDGAARMSDPEIERHVAAARRIAHRLVDLEDTVTEGEPALVVVDRGLPGEQVDARSDLYSTGCLLFELLTGRPPFVGDSPVAVAYQHVREPAMPPSEWPV